LKYLLTSFSINFDHKLIVGERCVCVFVKQVSKWVDQRVRSACRWSCGFLFGISLLLVLVGLLLLPMRTREEIFVSHKIYFHGTTTTTRWKAAEMLTIEIASLGVLIT